MEQPPSPSYLIKLPELLSIPFTKMLVGTLDEASRDATQLQGPYKYLF